MKKFTSFFVSVVFVLILIFSTFFSFTSAHEVYVLNQDEINFAMSAPAPDFIATIKEHLTQFLTWGLLAILAVVLVFFISINQHLERWIDPYLNKLKIYAPMVAQVTLGLALFASGYYQALFGIELPLHAVFGPYVQAASVGLEVLGAMLILGLLPRIAATIAFFLFIYMMFRYGIYTFNYLTYAGEALTIFMFGGAYVLYKNQNLMHPLSGGLMAHFHKYKFLIIRVFFGISLVYASLYAKLIHGALALETVTKFNLTNYFPFDPVFVVLGAMLVEVLLGLCFIFGFEIRFASIFFLVFLVLSLLFFGEAVWPHIILIGTGISMFMHGYDKYCLSSKLAPKKNLEPVL